MSDLKKTKDPEIKQRGGVYYYIGTPMPGQGQVFKSLKVKTFGAALKAKKTLLNDIRGLDPKAQTATYAEMARLIEKEQASKSRSSQLTAQAAMRNTVPFFGGYLVSRIDEPLVEEFILAEQTRAPERKLQNDIMYLNRVMLRAFAGGLTRTKRRFRCPDPERTKRRVLLISELRAMLQAADSEMTLFITMGATMGMRPGEMLSLETSCIDLDLGLITVRAEINKNRNSRVISVSGQVMEILRTYDLSKKYLFPFGSDRHLRSIKKRFATVVRNAGIMDHVTPYNLRHTFLTEAAKRIQGGKLGLVNLVKYADTSVEVFEKTYLHLTHEDTKAVSQMMDDLI